MNILDFSTGGFPLSVDRLKTMQECWAAINNALQALTAGLQQKNYLVTGCGNIKYSSSMSSYYFDGSANGWLVVQGEMLPFRASSGNYVAVVEEVEENLTYQDGTERPFSTARYAKLQSVKTDVSVYDFNYTDKGFSLSGIYNEAARRSELESAKARITALESHLAALDTSTGTNFGSLQKNLVPKGTIIMWSQTLPISSTTTSAVIKGMGDAYGYIPCGSWTVTAASIAAWNGYFDDLGLTATARFTSGSTILDFTSIAKKVGITMPNLMGRVPLGANTTYSLNSLGGSATHSLTVSELPPHSHALRAENGKFDWGNRHAYIIDSDNSGATTYSTKATGSGTAFSVIQPYAALNFLMKII